MLVRSYCSGTAIDVTRFVGESGLHWSPYFYPAHQQLLLAYSPVRGDAVHAIIRDNQFIYLNNLTQVEEDLVVDRFSLELQDYNRFVDPAQRGGWNGIYRRYDSRRQRLAMSASPGRTW